MMSSSEEYPCGLEKGSRKHRCPQCGQKTFVRYIDNTTGEYLPEQYGRCDHEQSCGYHLNPLKDGHYKRNGNTPAPVWLPRRLQAPPKQPPTAAPVVIPDEVYRPYEAAGLCSGFVRNLHQNVPFPFPDTDISKVVQLYRLGAVSGGYMTGAVCFPFIDTHGNIRAVQVMQYDETNHKTKATFLHALLRGCGGDWVQDYKKQDKLITCLFGAHLLKQYPHNPVALVEAPKTAVICALYHGFPDESSNNPVWVANFNKSSFTYDKLKVLEGRRVEVFPDLSKRADGDTHGATFQEWKRKAEALESKHPMLVFEFNKNLEQVATDEQRVDGLDLADFLINEDWRESRPTPPAPMEAEQPADLTPEPPTEATTDGGECSNTNPDVCRLCNSACKLYDDGQPGDVEEVAAPIETGQPCEPQPVEREQPAAPDELAAFLVSVGFPPDWRPRPDQFGNGQFLF